MDAGADPGTDGGEVEVEAEAEVDDGELRRPAPEVAGETVVAAVAEPAPREPTVLDRIQDELDDVERALKRLDDGSYGTCQACGTAIDDELLASRPTTRFCPEHEPAPAT